MKKHHFFSARFIAAKDQDISYTDLQNPKPKFIPGVGQCLFIGIEDIKVTFIKPKTPEQTAMILLSYTSVYQQQY